MGTKRNPGAFDCHAAAGLDEPIFVLRATDASAPGLVRQWVRQRLMEVNTKKRPEEDRAKVREALEVAVQMEQWRKENRG